MKKQIEKIISDFALEQKGISDCSSEILFLFLKEYEKWKPKKGDLLQKPSGEHDLLSYAKGYDDAVGKFDEVIYKMLK